MKDGSYILIVPEATGRVDDAQVSTTACVNMHCTLITADAQHLPQPAAARPGRSLSRGIVMWVHAHVLMSSRTPRCMTLLAWARLLDARWPVVELHWQQQTVCRLHMLTPPLLYTPWYYALQMWNSRFWPCFAAVPKCVDTQLDDVGFVADLLTNLQQQLLQGVPLKPKALLSGYSNGGMLAQALLCQQPSVASRLAGVSILASALGEQFAGGSCKGQLPASLPVLWVHGTADDTLPYGRAVSEGVQMLGAGEHNSITLAELM